MRALSIVAVVAVAGCSPSGGGAKTTTTTTSATTASTTTTTSITSDAAVLAAYRAFWDAYRAAGDPMDPENPVLAEHATGTELVNLQKAFLARKAGGEVIRGTLDLAPRVVTVLGDKAAVRDCLMDNTGVYDAGSGARKDTATGVRHLITASMQLEAGAWKVSTITKEGDGCTSA